jgi:hypothetical protein
VRGCLVWDSWVKGWRDIGHLDSRDGFRCCQKASCMSIISTKGTYRKSSPVAGTTQLFDSREGAR